MKEREYRVLAVRSGRADRLADQLNAPGIEGWQLVLFPGESWAVSKRPKTA